MKFAILVIIISYFIGNFSTSYVLGKLFRNKDIRNYGSGNAGATNALRVFGPKFAAITFLVDALKGTLAVIIGSKIMGFDGELLAGISVIVGHNWPIVLNFRGGKGMASTIGVMLTVNYVTAIICIFVGIIVVFKTKYVSLASILSVTFLPIVGVLINKPFNIHFFIFTLILTVMAIYRHKSNIVRLINGTEHKIGERV